LRVPDIETSVAEGGVNELIEWVRGVNGAQVNEQAHSWVVRLKKEPDAAVEIVISRSVPEWFVTLESANGVTWSDWVDYLGYQKKDDKSSIVIELCRDVRYFISTLLEAERVHVRWERRLLVFKRAVAWWCVRGRWRPVRLSAEAMSRGA
jgi:hypothetical protein